MNLPRAGAASCVRCGARISAVYCPSGPDRAGRAARALAARITARRQNALPIKAKASIHKI
jgi:hypothetical protein